MRLSSARVRNYRSVVDTGWFEIEQLKTILVGPNEAGKTVVLQALQQLNRPGEVGGFEALRDYPRSKYNDIKTGQVDPDSLVVVEGRFQLEDSDRDELPPAYHECQYEISRKLNNTATYKLVNAPPPPSYSDLQKDLIRLAAHADKNFEESEGAIKPSVSLTALTQNYRDSTLVKGDVAKGVKAWLESNLQYIDEEDTKEEKRYETLVSKINSGEEGDSVLQTLYERMPVFILFNNYFKVKPNIHLGHLAQRVEQNILDDEYYDYGNLCLLKLLGFSARELSELGAAASPDINNKDALKSYRDKLDSRSYQLNAASVRLTNEIRLVWAPNPDRPEADKLKVVADGQYLKVVVEDDLGVEIELDQRSEGFQWLVSFFIVFFAEAMDKHENAVLLLDEPGMSLHALKQRDFRDTISRLAENNQTLFTTHSPFLVGPDELDIVRVVEMTDRSVGTKVHTTLSSDDPAGLLPLQEALGYDLAHSLFAQTRNLILEGITDYWYLEATSELIRGADAKQGLNDKIALVFANSAGKVVYYATILHAHNLKVASLLDSDAAGDQAAQQETLVHTLGNKNILRTKDFCSVPKAEIEDLLRDTLPTIVQSEFGVDVSKIVAEQSTRPIVDIIANEVDDFSKYRLAKSYIRWTREHGPDDLSKTELEEWTQLIETINKRLK